MERTVEIWSTYVEESSNSVEVWSVSVNVTGDLVFILWGFEFCSQWGVNMNISVQEFVLLNFSNEFIVWESPVEVFTLDSCVANFGFSLSSFNLLIAFEFVLFSQSERCALQFAKINTTQINTLENTYDFLLWFCTKSESPVFMWINSGRVLKIVGSGEA
jgi:hypothetical protein